MDNKFVEIIQKQEEIIAELEKIHAADQTIIDSQNQQIHFLQKKFLY